VTPTSSPALVPPQATPPGGASVAARPSGVIMAPSNLAFDTDFSDATAMVEPAGSVRGSGAGILGWLLLAAVLFGGVGVIIYVAMGERDAQSAREAAAADAAAMSGHVVTMPDAMVKTEVAVEKPDAAKPVEVEKPREPEHAALHEPARDRGEHHGTVVETHKSKVEGIPRTEKDAAELLAEAKAEASALKWDLARDSFSRIAQGRFYKGAGLLGQAKVAWETKDVDGAITLAQRAVKAGAGDPARILLGHAYYKKNDFARALSYYESVLKHDPKNDEAKRSAELVRQKMRGI